MKIWRKVTDLKDVKEHVSLLCLKIIHDWAFFEIYLCEKPAAERLDARWE